MPAPVRIISVKVGPQLGSGERATCDRLRCQRLRECLRNSDECRETWLPTALLSGNHPHMRGTCGSGETGIDQRHSRCTGCAGGSHGVLGHAGVFAHRNRDERAAACERTQAHADPGLN